MCSILWGGSCSKKDVVGSGITEEANDCIYYGEMRRRLREL